MKNLIKKLLFLVIATIVIVTNSKAVTLEYVVGTGNAASTTSYNLPFYNTYGCTKGEYLFTQADMEAAGMFAGEIVKLALMPLTNTSAGGSTNDWGTLHISLANTSLTAFDPSIKTGFTAATWEEVFTQTNYTFGLQTANTWVDYTFDTPFDYTGGGLLVIICFENAKSSNTTIGNFRGSATAPGEKTFISYKDNDPNFCAGIGTLTNKAQTYRPDMRFGLNVTGIAKFISQQPKVKLYANDIFDEAQRPKVKIVRAENPATLPTAQFKYTIIGPLSATDTVYRANNGAWINISTTLGATDYTFTSANGRMANTDGTLNLVHARPGTYTVITTIDDKQAPVSEHTTTFQIDSVSASYTVVASAGAHGAISPSGTVPGFPGVSRTFIFTPATNYAVSKVYVDGVLNAAAAQAGEYTFAGTTTGSHTIQVEFAAAYIVGTGNAASTTTYNAPFYNVYGCGHGEYLFTQADIAASGMTAGLITKLAIMPLTTTSAAGATNNWGTMRIRLANTNLTAFPAGKTDFTAAAWEDVYTKQNYTFGLQTANTWVDYVLDDPFVYTGGGLLVRICYENSKSSNTTIGNFRGSATASGEKMFFTFQDNNPSICSAPGSSRNQTQTYRPDMRFGVESAGVALVLDQKPSTKLYANDIFSESQRPKTKIARLEMDPPSLTAQFRYTIIGPLSATDTVYRANNGAWININPAIGANEYTFASANGRMANANGTLNLVHARPGTYTVITEIDDKQSATTTKKTTTFQIDSVSASYTVTASAGPHGTISPSGTIPGFPGASRTFVFTPATNYAVSKVYVDGVLNAAAAQAGQYTFAGTTTGNHTIRVEFSAAYVVGTGNATNTSSYNAPFYGTYGCGHGEYLFTQADIAASGMTAGLITKLAIMPLTTTSATGATNNWGTMRIRLANANLTAFPAGKTAFTVADWEDVYTKQNYTFGLQTANTWVDYVLDNPFVYTGGALLVRICYENSKSSNTTIGHFRGSVTAAGEKMFFTYQDNNPSMCSGPGAYNTSQTYRPDMRFGVESAGVVFILEQKPNTKLYANDILDESQRPKVKMARLELDPPSVTSQFKYTIIGPLSATDTVYRANNGTWMNIAPNLGIEEYVFTSANGRMANIDGTLNLTQARPGTYTVITEIDDKQSTETTKKTTTFQLDSTNMYIITAISVGSGSISPSGSVPIFPGVSKKFTFTPNPGYVVDSVLIDGVHNPVAMGAKEYTFSNVTSNRTIKVKFTRVKDAIVGLGNTETQTGNAPFYTTYGCGSGEYLFTQGELAAAEINAGTIRGLGLQLVTYNASGASNLWGTLRISIANTGLQEFPTGKSSFSPGPWTEVCVRPNFVFGTRTANEWIKFDFDAPFNYTGGGLLVKICYEGTKTSNTAIGTFRASTTATAGAKTYFIRADNNTTFCSLTTGTEVGKVSYRPDMLFAVMPGPQKFKNITSSLEYKLSVPRNNVIVNKTEINFDNDSTGNGVNVIKQIMFDANTTNPAHVSSVKCYYSHKNDFAEAVPYGDATSISSNMVFTQDMECKAQKYYFWLVYDVRETVPDGSKISGKIVSIRKSFEDVEETMPNANISFTNPDPGEVTIKLPLSAGSYTIGEGGDYKELSEFAEAYREIGINKNTVATIISNTTETEQSLFTKAPLGDYTLTIRPAQNITPIIQNGTVTTEPLVVFNGCKNISLEGSNSTTVRNKSLTFTSKPTAIKIINSENIEISDVIFTGTGNSDSIKVNITGGEYIKLDRNDITNASIGLYASGVKDLLVRYNTISTVASGLVLEGANLGAEVLNNQFLNIYHSSVNTFGMRFVGTGINTPLGIKIYNNTINGINSGASSVAIAFNNISGIDIAHNTVYMFKRSGQTTNTNSSVLLEEVVGNSKVSVRNNIFYNDLSGGVNGIFASPNTTSNPFDLLDNNIYFARSAFRGLITGASPQNFNAWKAFVAGAGAGKNDANSVWYTAEDFTLVSETDSHLDGKPCVKSEFRVPVLPEVPQDMDGETRGDNLTVAGADHLDMNFTQEDTNYPSDEFYDTVNELSLCEGVSDLLLHMRKTFTSWKDGVNRRYIPIVENTWVRSPFDNPAQEDILNLDDKFYVNADGIYCKNLTYEYAGNYRVYSKLGDKEFTSNWFPVRVTKIASMAVQPKEEILACSDAGSIVVATEIDGTITSVQWERKVNGVWVQVPNATNKNLTITIANEADLASKSGEYRLRLNAPGTCDFPRTVYSNVCIIDAGYPITEVTAVANYDAEKLLSLCENEELILTANVQGTALAYRWQKYDEILEDFVDISSAVEPTAAESQYRIVSISKDNSGLYRCFVEGPELCQTGTEGISNVLEVRIKETSRILQHPSEIIACVGNKEAVLEPVVSGDVYYQWYKDSKLIEGATSARLDFYNRIDSVSRDTTILGRDTTVVLYDTLGIKYEDAGVYEVEIYYINCAGELDTMRSNPVPVYVYGNTSIANQTNYIYAVRDGYGVLEVEASTLGSDFKRETYQWYRKRGTTNIEKLANSSRIRGANSSRIVISGLTSADINDPNNPEDYYYCVVTGVCNEATTKAISIKLVPEIVISKDLTSLEICEAEDAVFEVTAYGTEPNEPIAFAWYKDNKLLVDGGNISGATTNRLVISSATTADIGDYQADIKYVNLGAAILTSSANLLVEAPPVITTQPAPVSIDLINTKDFMLTVEVEEQYDGYVCSYQWYRNNTEILNAIDSYYMVTNAELEDAGEYYVVVTSLRGCGSATSKKINVTIEDSNIDEKVIDNNFAIVSIVPNPASNKALLNYNILNSGEVSIRVVDVTGRMIKSLFTGYATAGLNELPVDMSSIQSGTYYIVLESNGMQTTHPLVIVK